MVKRLFKIQNLNASTIRTVMVADCSRFDSPDLLLDAGDQTGLPCRVFDLGGDSEEEPPGPGLQSSGSGRVKEGLRRMLDSVLDGHAQLSDCALEAKVAELLAQGHTKPQSVAMLTPGTSTSSSPLAASPTHPIRSVMVGRAELGLGGSEPRRCSPDQQVHKHSLDHALGSNSGFHVLDSL